MSDTGWKLPAGSSSAQNGGNNDWANHINVRIEDLVYASYGGTKEDGSEPEDQPSLRAVDFSFGVPENAIITGIEAKIIGSISQGNESVYLTQMGSPILYGQDKKQDWSPPSTNALLSPLTYVYGSENDLWGTNDLTPAIVNSATFGWVFMLFDDADPPSSSIDHMQMKVYYKEQQTAAMMGAGF